MSLGPVCQAFPVSPSVVADFSSLWPITEQRQSKGQRLALVHGPGMLSLTMVAEAVARTMETRGMLQGTDQQAQRTQQEVAPPITQKSRPLGNPLPPAKPLKTP